MILSGWDKRMYGTIKAATTILVVALCQATLASGVGAAFYQPAPIQPASYHSPVGCTDACSDGNNCQRIGFAGVDRATPNPCAVDGCCTPKRSTYGHYTTRWRRWPGDTDNTGLTPEEVLADDSLLEGNDPPPASEEDQQAPPPIEDEFSDNDGSEDSTLELQVPPLPEINPRPPRPDLPPTLEPEDDEENFLPFGATEPKLPVFIDPTPKQANVPVLPQEFRPDLEVKPASGKAAAKNDGPPPLPWKARTAAVSKPMRLPTAPGSPTQRGNIQPVAYEAAIMVSDR